MEEKTITVVGIDIEKVDPSRVSLTLKKVAEFQEVVRRTLKPGQDYGVIPGASKPTLLKPGAEKILMVFGLASSYQLLEEVRDYEKGFFAFTVKCVLAKDGVPITEGLGHANTREKRYVSGKAGDPFTLANTVLKMAKKRALVDAVLTVASLSEIFTQDIEDMVEEGEAVVETLAEERATDKQIYKILDLVKGFVPRNPDEDVETYKKRRQEAIEQKLGKPLSELTKKEASQVIEKLSAKQEAPF